MFAKQFSLPIIVFTIVLSAVSLSAQQLTPQLIRLANGKSLDLNIPPALHAFMGKRAGGREVIEVAGASHVVMISHHNEVAELIARAATAE